MMTILQTDTGLYEPINKYGCYFMSLIAIASHRYKVDYTQRDIRILYDRCTYSGAMDSDCYVMAPDAILRLSAKLFTQQITERIVQVGMQDTSGERFWGWVKGKEIDYTIAKFKTMIGNYHFLLLNKDGSVYYDPSPTCKVSTRVALIYYRVFGG